MSLSITPDLIRELADSRVKRPAIVLTTGGWEVEAHPGNYPPPALTALTLEGLVTAWMDGDELDEEMIPAILDEVGERHLCDEHGRPADDDGDWVVVLPRHEDLEDAEPDGWALAYVIDLAEATELVHAAERRAPAEVHDLYRTRTGRYLDRIDDRHAESCGIRWHEVTPGAAAQWLYEAGEGEVLAAARDDVLADAVRHAAAIRDLLTPPARHYDSDEEVRRAQINCAAAADEPLFAVIRVVSDLLRVSLTADLKQARGAVAATVYEAEQRNGVHAAKRLGVSRITMLDLIGPRE